MIHKMFKDLLSTIHIMPDPIIDLEDMQRSLVGYAEWKYSDVIENSYQECPYEMRFSSDMQYKQVMTWIMQEWRNEEGITVLEEFVNKFVDDEDLRKMLLRMKDPIRDTFKILKKPDSKKRMKVESQSDGKRFTVEFMGANPDNYTAGSIFTGTIHPWYDNGIHRACGILLLMSKREGIGDPSGLAPHEIRQMIKDFLNENVESIVIEPKAMTYDLFVKLPINWLSRICCELGTDSHGEKEEKIRRIAGVILPRESLRRIIKALDEDEEAALEFIRKKGGSATYASLCKKFGDDDTPFCSESPTSPIEALRRKGLIIVGMQKRSRRMYKVAAIPADVLHSMQGI